MSGTVISMRQDALLLGTTTVALPTPEANSNPRALAEVGGQAITKDGSSAVVGGQTIQAGAGAVTVEGTPISLGGSAIVIGTNTVALPQPASSPSVQVPSTSQPASFTSQESSLSPTTANPGTQAQASPTELSTTGFPVTSSTIQTSPVVSATSVGPSQLTSSALTTNQPSNSFPILNAGGQTFTALPGNNSGLEINGSTITPGAQAVTVDGESYSINANNTLVIGGSTFPVATGNGDGFLTAGGETFKPLASDMISIDGYTITVSGPGVLQGNRKILLETGGLMIDSSTYAFAAPVNPGPITGTMSQQSAPLPSVFIIDGQTFTANTSGLAISNTKVMVGGSAITINGTTISLDLSTLVVGSDPIPIASVSDLGPALFGAVPIATTAASTTAAASTTHSLATTPAFTVLPPTSTSGGTGFVSGMEAVRWAWIVSGFGMMMWMVS